MHSFIVPYITSQYMMPQIHSVHEGLDPGNHVSTSHYIDQTVDHRCYDSKSVIFPQLIPLKLK